MLYVARSQFSPQSMMLPVFMIHQSNAELLKHSDTELTFIQDFRRIMLRMFQRNLEDICFLSTGMFVIRLYGICVTAMEKGERHEYI